MSALLEAKGLRVTFTSGSAIGARLFGRPKTELAAVDGIDLVLERGSSVGVVGESGCGKSTLARALVGLAPLSGGTILFDGQPLSGKRDRTSLRRIQMVFQDPSSSLNPSRTIGQTLTELLSFHNMVPADRVEARASELMNLVELPPALLGAYPRRLSGGQRQRVGIARALALEPDILIADEAVSALDVSVQASVLNLLNRLRDELNLTIVFISHDLAVVRHATDRVMVMYLGRVVEDRPTEDLFNDPQHPYTQALLTAAPHLGERKRSGESALPGEPPSLAVVPSGCRFHPRCARAIDLCHAMDPPLAGPASDQRAACFLAWEAVPTVSPK